MTFYTFASIKVSFNTYNDNKYTIILCDYEFILVSLMLQLFINLAMLHYDYHAPGLTLKLLYYDII